jgi:hypothetical protein
MEEADADVEESTEEVDGAIEDSGNTMLTWASFTVQAG